MGIHNLSWKHRQENPGNSSGYIPNPFKKVNEGPKKAAIAPSSPSKAPSPLSGTADLPQKDPLATPNLLKSWLIHSSPSENKDKKEESPHLLPQGLENGADDGENKEKYPDDGENGGDGEGDGGDDGDYLGSLPEHLAYLEDDAAKSKEDKLLKQLARVKIELHKRKLALDPTQYGLPDLLSLQKEGREAQEQGIIDVCKLLVIIPNGPPRPIKLIPVQIEFLVDLFFGHNRYAILWKPRGGGGSLVIAVLMWLLAVYKQKSCLDLAGGLDQSRAVYDYTKGFWEGLPLLKKALLADAPMKNETVLRSGASIKCVPASDRQVKGKHCPVLILDEACQKQSGIDAVFMDAMQGVFSEPDPIIVMNSTFYYPQGLFQAYWDGAYEKGFKKYKWTAFQCLQRCDLDICFKGCELSWEVDVLDAAGKPTGVKEWIGCCGTAHETDGFQTREAVIESRRVNEGTNVFEVQHMGHRPAWMDTVYPLKAIEKCVVKHPTVDLSRCDFVVGIDWGLVGQTAVILMGFDREYRIEGQKIPGKVAVLEAEFMTGKLTSEVANIIQQWMAEYEAQFPVFPDGSHPFNNLELERSGFEVVPVYAVKWKEYGIGNVRKYLVNGRIEIPRNNLVLLSQLKKYQRLPSGRTNKRVSGGDHGPDALSYGLICWPFLEWFGEKVDVEKDADQVILI